MNFGCKKSSNKLSLLTRLEVDRIARDSRSSDGQVRAAINELDRRDAHTKRTCVGTVRFSKFNYATAHSL